MAVTVISNGNIIIVIGVNIIESNISIDVVAAVAAVACAAHVTGWYCCSLFSITTATAAGRWSAMSVVTSSLHTVYEHNSVAVMISLFSPAHFAMTFSFSLPQVNLFRHTGWGGRGRSPFVPFPSFYVIKWRHLEMELVWQ